MDGSAVGFMELSRTTGLGLDTLRLRRHVATGTRCAARPTPRPSLLLLLCLDLAADSHPDAAQPGMHRLWLLTTRANHARGLHAPPTRRPPPTTVLISTYAPGERT